MAKNVKLLLVENVEALGIVGDVVTVRSGYARNFLLPRGLATAPSEELVQSLAAKRAQAQQMLAEQRKQREETSARLQGLSLELVRSCNDQGVLYGGITQQDVAAELAKLGHAVRPRDVRLPGAIKRVDSYEIHIKMDVDLDAVVRLTVKPDRELPKEGAPPVEGEKPKGEKGEASEKTTAAEVAAASTKAEEPRERRSRREDREERRDQAMRRRADAIEQAIAADKARVVGWGGKAADAAPKGEEQQVKTAKGKGKPESTESKAAKSDKPKAEKSGKTKGEKTP
jgi:large subunit ribosomal protein L9